MKRILAVMWLFNVCCGGLWAATYYISPSGNDSTGAGSTASPWRTLSRAFSMGGGNIYVLKDGTYNYAGSEINGVPNGSTGSYTVIKAENDGGAVITQSGGLNLVHTNQYLRVEGIKFIYASQKNVLGNHIKFFRCAFVGGASSGNQVNTVVGSNDYSDTDTILFEDCWWYGSGGRYNVICYNADRVIVRRCVIRHDGGWDDLGTADPEAGLIFYNSANCMAQNVIVIDCDLTYKTWAAGFYSVKNTSTAHLNQNNKWEGCIHLVGKNLGLMMDTDASVNNVVTDCVFWDTVNGGISLGGGGSNSVTIDRVTLGRSKLAASGDFKGGIGAWNTGTRTISNLIITGWPYRDLDGVSASALVSYGNGGTAGGALTYNPFTNGLTYLCRVEGGTRLAADGSGGGRIGADITKRIGTSGTLYGDTGFDTPTQENLWPWPNETRIKTDMAQVSARGFCASGMTLTRYVWEYLGTAIPADIYGGSPVNNPPTAAAGANPATGMAPLSVSFTGSGSDTDGTITAYSWSFGDGTTSTQQNPAHTYASPGTYTAALTVTDNGGATGTAAVTVTVNTVYTIGGTIKDKSGRGIQGITIALSGDAAGAATTDAAGAYQFTGLVRGGSFVLTPGRTSWSFTPVSISTMSLNGNLTNQNFTGAPLYAIQGSVTSAGTPLNGTTMALSGNATRSVITGADGMYQFGDLPSNSNYTVTPSKTGYVFTPVSMSTGSLMANISSANFSGTAPVTYALRGYVRDAATTGIAGVTMTLSGNFAATTMSGADGSFQITGIPAGGNYTLTPSRAGFVFSPAALIKSGLNGSLDNQNFIATQVFHIAGSINNDRGAAAGGVTVALSGATSATMNTGSDGSYRFDGLSRGGNYTVTPTKNSWKFSPASLNVPSLPGDLDDQNFTGSRRFYIRGTVRSNSGVVISDALVVLSGAQGQSMTTDKNGVYQFSELPENSTYTVTSAKSGYLFSPSQRTTSELIEPIDNWDFIGVYLQTLSGGEVRIIGPATSKGTVNPDRGETAKILFKGNAPGVYALRIFTLTGELVYQDQKENVSDGVFEWAPRDAASGIYIAHIQGPGINTRSKIAVIR